MSDTHDEAAAKLGYLLPASAANQETGEVVPGVEAAARVLREHYGRTDDDQPITDDWLRLNGWFRLGGEEMPTRRREIGMETLDDRLGCRSSDDLCIDVAPWNDGTWFCWLRRTDPHHSIHVRKMQTVGDLKRLYEGLTGIEWTPGRAYGEYQEEQSNG